MLKRFYSLIIILLLQSAVFSQDCNEFKSLVDESVKKVSVLLDSTLNGNSKPDYFESLIVYPVLNRYYNKQKSNDSIIVKKYSDLARTIWCFKGVCFNNNKTFYQSKKQIEDKLASNESLTSYQRESVCMLCNKYLKDTTQIKKILDYTINADLVENENAANYGLLHKPLQLVNLKAGKCISNELFNRYKVTLIDTIYRKFISPFIQSSDLNNQDDSKNIDLFSEALLMISILDDEVNISEDLYLLLLDRQLPNNGWASKIESFTPNGHTTIVAYWVLLDLKKKLLKYK